MKLTDDMLDYNHYKSGINRHSKMPIGEQKLIWNINKVWWNISSTYKNWNEDYKFSHFEKKNATIGEASMAALYEKCTERIIIWKS